MGFKLFVFILQMDPIPETCLNTKIFITVLQVTHAQTSLSCLLICKADSVRFLLFMDLHFLTTTKLLNPTVETS